MKTESFVTSIHIFINFKLKKWIIWTQILIFQFFLEMTNTFYKDEYASNAVGRLYVPVRFLRKKE